MKQYLLPQEGQFYKANMHCHSTCSDGALTPEELKELYKSAGYSILAYTDHNVLIDHSDLDDEEFLAITGCEIDIVRRNDKPISCNPCYHLNMYPMDQHQTVLPCFNPNIWGKRRDLIEAQKYIGTPNYVRKYDNANELIEEFRKLGFLVSVNHPSWSVQYVEDLVKTEGIFAMEIYNNACYLEGFDEVNSRMYDEVLHAGKRIWCMAADDNHNINPKNLPQHDSLGGFIMVKAKELTYPSVWDAIKAGHFYASTGPEIKELYIEDNKLYIKTSPAVRIAMSTAARQARCAIPDGGIGTITEAVFDISDLYPGYFRITVDDERGHHAWSQPCFGDFAGYDH